MEPSPDAAGPEAAGTVSGPSPGAVGRPADDAPSVASRFPSRVDALDALRSSAALLVFGFHYFALYPDARGSIFEPMAGAVLSYFGMGVPLFYALSGLSLCLGFFDMRGSPHFLRRFFIRRFLRIAPLFYFAALVWVLIFLSRGVTPSPIDLIATLTFVFNLLPGLHESFVAAGWSIGVEMLFYLLFPVIVTFVTGVRSALAFFALSSVVSIVSFRFLSQELPKSTYAGLAAPAHLQYFAAGILVYFVARQWATRPSAQRWSRVALTGGLLLLVLTSIGFLTSGSLVAGLLDGSFIRVAWALPIGGILVLGMRARPATRVIRPFARLGEWGYSLYLMHPICLYFVFEYLRHNRASILSESGRFGVYFGVGLASLVGVSALTFRLVESPFLRLGRRWSRSTVPDRMNVRYVRDRSEG